MDRNIVKTILIAGALTGMAFGTMYVVQRARNAMGADDEYVRTTAGYTVPRPTERATPEPEHIPVTIDVVEDDEEDED